ILSRRKKNNPILIGEPGVGKSAVVEGLANLIVSGKVPRVLQHRRIVALDMASIVAGTQYRGQFEDRLQRLIKELRAHREIILFIDEIHTIIGAGSAPGSLDAANILKPALARGEIQCIGATTTDEYRKTIEKDGALERRFQKIQLASTTLEQTLEILRNLKKRYEEHHNVSYTDEALQACVNLTARYISDRALPDKAIDALDEAGSRVHISGVKVPENIEKLEKCIADLKRHKTEAAKAQNYELAANLRDEVAQLTDKLEHANKDWIDSLKEDRPTVTAEDISTIVSMMSGIPVQRMAQDESTRLRGMKAALQAKVISQDEAISHLVRAITRNRLGLKGTDRPIGTFLFVGPTGVGKTYLVKCLAEWMFGSKEDLIRIDMSEYGEKYSTSRLVGAPPGYVGYDEGGQLTEKVRRHPYSVILLDEIEKAHPDVFNTLLQVMDEGRLTDGNGTTVDFRNTIIIMTSNSGTRQLKDFGRGIGFKEAATDDADGKMVEQIIRKALQKQFSPEFLNRLDDIITFHPLTEADAGKIADLEIGALKERLEKMQLSLELTTAAKDYVVKKGFNVQYGARSLKRSIQANIEDAICDLIMNETQDKTGQPQTIRFDVVDEKLVAQFTSPTSMP
ncbi:MAG: ATP-dependent Clp protease ATP-binding subunit, partial [Alloprevotella tannerae]|nr:ATP-dependent Clp protease ATP-binding subunit [Alloprevotella tannerae]